MPTDPNESSTGREGETVPSGEAYGAILARHHAPAQPDDARLSASVSGATTRPAQVAVPHRLGPYVLDKELGRGGMGAVYRAHNTKLGTACAVKVFFAGMVASEERVQRFLREAQSVARMGKHQNIVGVFDQGREGPELYYAMELIDGDPLDVFCEKRGNQVGYTEAASLVEKVARALHFAHEHEVVHRDMKPQNILVRRDGEPQVTDFGLALVSTDARLSSANEVLGTPLYAAPEQARGDTLATDRRTDVYGLGGVLYFMLTGGPPHSEGTMQGALAAIEQGRIAPPRRVRPDVPLDIDTICMKCLDPEKERRYQTAEALADDLARFRMGDPVLARRAGPFEKAWRWARRHWRGTAIAAAVLVAVAAGVWARVALRGKKGAEEDAAAARKGAREVERLAPIHAFLATGDTCEAQGDHFGALHAYREAYQKADPEQREQLLDRMARSAWGLGVSPQAVEEWKGILELAPDRDFGEYETSAQSALLVDLSDPGEDEPDGFGVDYRRAALRRPEKAKALLKRLYVSLNKKDARVEARMTATRLRDQIEPVLAETGPLPVGDEPKSRFLPDDDTPALKKQAEEAMLGGWPRGSAAYVVATRLEKADEKVQALAWYRKAVEWMRVGNPFYSFRVHMSTRSGEDVTDKSGRVVEHNVTYQSEWVEDSEPARLLVKADEAVRRLDPKEPRHLRGGLVLTLAPQGRPDKWFPVVDVSLLDKAKGGSELGHGPMAEVSVPLDGKARIGVADGTYRVHLERGAQNSFESDAARDADPACELDFEKADLEVTVDGGWTELPLVRVRRIVAITLTPNEETKDWDPKKAPLTWTEVGGAAKYRVRMIISPADLHVGVGLSQLTADVEGTKAMLDDYLAKVQDRDAVESARKMLGPRCTVMWGVEALDGSGKRLGSSGDLRQVTLPAAKPGK